MTAAQPPARLNTYLGPKRQLLGNPAGRVAPAWKTDAAAQAPTAAKAMFAKGKHAEQGSKIFLSKLPLDVDEKEVEVRGDHIKETTKGSFLCDVCVVL
jgi:THO complex subunit 4